MEKSYVNKQKTFSKIGIMIFPRHFEHKVRFFSLVKRAFWGSEQAEKTFVDEKNYCQLWKGSDLLWKSLLPYTQEKKIPKNQARWYFLPSNFVKENWAHEPILLKNFKHIITYLISELYLPVQYANKDDRVFCSKLSKERANIVFFVRTKFLIIGLALQKSILHFIFSPNPHCF